MPTAANDSSSVLTKKFSEKWAQFFEESNEAKARRESLKRQTASGF